MGLKYVTQIQIGSFKYFPGPILAPFLIRTVSIGI